MRRLVNRLFYHLKIYFWLVKFSLMDILIFRVNALIIGLAPIVWLAAMLVFIATVFLRVKDLGGWSFWEVVFLTGTHEVVFLLSWSTFLANLRKFVDEVRGGGFDWILLKPTNPRFLVSFRSLDFTTIGSFLNVIFVFFFSFNKVVMEINLPRLIGFLILLVFAYWIAYFVYFIFAALALFFIDSRAFVDWVFEAVDFARYPAEIYSSWMRFFLFFFLPVLFFSYVPTAFFLGKLGWEYLVFSFGVMVIFYLISHFVWQLGLRHYQSTSS